MKRFEGKVVLFCGGGGISNGTAKRLAAEGATLVIGDIMLDSATATVEELKAGGYNAVAMHLDIGDETSIKAFIEASVSEFGGFDGLFNVAADTSRETVMRDTDLLDIPIDVWERTLRIDLTGYFLTIRHALPHLLKRGGGAIVNTTSAAVHGGQCSLVAYSAAKSGVAALTRHVANRWGRDGIRCNSVSPGMILSGAEKKLAPEMFEEGKFDYDLLWTGMASRRGGPPSTRLGKPEDIAAAVAFLLSEDAGYINGQSLGVDGGIMFR